MGNCAKNKSRDFPGSPVVGSLPANAGDMGSIPGLERPHMPERPGAGATKPMPQHSAPWRL